MDRVKFQWPEGLRNHSYSAQQFLTREEWKDLFLTIIKLGLSLGASYYLTILMIDYMKDSMGDNKKVDYTSLLNYLKNKGWVKTNSKGKPVQTFNKHELKIASSILFSKDLKGFESIGGLTNQIEKIYTSVLRPLKLKVQLTEFTKSKQTNLPELSATLLKYKSTSGVLLYGPPGCGKTQLVKCLASEANIPVINLDTSNIMDKWVGESNKLVKATFSLARKLAPSIIFIDEVDSLLSKRSDRNHELTNEIKAQFMTLWDGIDTGNEPIILIGATNRQTSLDPAILRRFTTKINVPLPQTIQILDIYKVHLKNLNTTNITTENWVEITNISFKNKFSGADIKQVCENNCIDRIEKFISKSGDGKNLSIDQFKDLEPISYNQLKKSILSYSEQKIFAFGKPSEELNLVNDSID